MQMKRGLFAVLCASMIAACTQTPEDPNPPSLGEETTAQPAAETSSEVSAFGPEPIDLQLAEAAARRDPEALWQLFGDNGSVDTEYMRTAHRNWFKPLEDKVARAVERGELSIDEATSAIFAARVSVRACTVWYLSQACEIVGTAPQAELRALADSL